MTKKEKFITPELLKALEEQRMTPEKWAALALRAIPFRAKSWRAQAERNVAGVIQQAMSASRRCRYCHRLYSGKACNNWGQFTLHPARVQDKMAMERDDVR